MRCTDVQLKGRKTREVTRTNTNTRRLRDETHFLSSVLDVGWRISIKAAPNFYSNQRKAVSDLYICAELTRAVL